MFIGSLYFLSYLTMVHFLLSPYCPAAHYITNDETSHWILIGPNADDIAVQYFN
jgi:hypothetical protein